jgi:hypothetical protein
MLKDSIIKADLATAKSLVSSLDTISMRNLLDRNIDGENCIALVRVEINNFWYQITHLEPRRFATATKK